MDAKPAETGYYWVQNAKGLWDVAVWSREGWWCFDSQPCAIPHERAGFVSWIPIAPPGPTVSYD